MLDIRYIKENLEAVRENIKNRYVSADADKAVRLYDERNALIQELDGLRRTRNENAKKMKGKMPQAERQTLIEEGKKLKQDISAREKLLEDKEKELNQELSLIPNMTHPNSPIGKDDTENKELRVAGTIPQFGFQPKDHTTLGTELDIIDFETATKVSGTKFYYLKNQGVFLELALIQFAMMELSKRGFAPFITPDIAKEEIAEGTGFSPRGEESNIYTLEGTGTCLIGTAEITLGGYYSDNTLEPEQLPIKLSGLSHCFRREAGAAGQYAKGLYRVHQFTKVEMFILCHPDESAAMHTELLEVEESIFSKLGIPYRVVDICTGDLGGPAYRKYDLEAWMPGRGESGDWGEITSTSNCTDYQARRLNIKVKENDKKQHVHLLNGTAVAVSRAIVAILENFQQQDGSVMVPEALRPYTGFSKIPAIHT